MTILRVGSIFPVLMLWLVALGAVILGSGCPSTAPKLTVAPKALSLGAGQNVSTFRISNTGGGTLNWQVTEDLPWLSISLQGGAKSSSVLQGVISSAKEDVIQIIVDRTKLQSGSTSGVIQVTSNAGTESVQVHVMQPEPARMEVSDTSLDFGLLSTSQQFVIRNTGSETLHWTINIDNETPWITAAPASGSINAGGLPVTVSVTVDRGSLAAGTHTGTLVLNSNGGNVEIAVLAEIAPFRLLPDAIEFGRILDTSIQTLVIESGGMADVNLSLEANTESGGNWLQLSQTTAVLPGEGQFDVQVSAVPGVLAAGMYNGTIRVRDLDSGYERSVPVSMSISSFSVSSNLVDFGVISASQEAQLVITVLGVTSTSFTASISATDSNWLSVTPVSGSISNQATLTLVANPTAVIPGNYETTLTLTIGGEIEPVTVRMTRPEPPALQASPRNIDFGTNRNQELLAIWNRGIGTIDWRVETADFPAWLSILPVDLNGVASGTVSGDATAQLTVRVDRAAAPANTFSFEHTMTIQAAGDSTSPVSVTVRMQIAPVPHLVIQSDGLDDTGTNYLSFDVNQVNKTFTLRNQGNGTLSWQFDLTNRPAWLASVSPSQGSLEPGSQQQLTVTVDRSSLTYVGAQQVFTINSNDPNNPQQSLLIQVQVPKKASITSRPSSFSFGINVNNAILEVANSGDPDTVLNFQIFPSKEWLSVYPETGRSIGTSTDILDWRSISVTVDRTQLEGAGASAKLLIRAYEVRDGINVPVGNIPPREVEVSVEAASLTIEVARPRTRIPSLVRYVLLMRNIRQQPIFIPRSRLHEIGQLFSIEERSIPLESSETNQFLTSGERIRANVFILLDYSGSMQEAAHMLVEAGELGDPENPPSDPLQLLYEETISHLLTELPEQYRVGLAIFNDRESDFSQKIRIIKPNAAAPTFTKDKNELLARLYSIQVEDNGATELLPAVELAAMTLVQEDELFMFPFDDADMRALICVSDGRLTTPPGTIQDTVDLLESNGVRFFGIGWGNKVLREPLVRLAAGTGGHFYATLSRPTGEFDAFGIPIREPQFSELLRWFTLNPDDPCDQSIANDFRAQVVLSYVTLSEESNADVTGNLSFDDPNDQNSPCIVEQGIISGSFSHAQLDFSAISGDVRMGQISLETEGVNLSDGSAEITVRAEYISRNIQHLQFSIDSDSGMPFTIIPVPASRGGLVADWTMNRTGNEVGFTSPDNTPILYGQFGDLFVVRFENINPDFRVFFNVLAPLRNPANPNSKYFMYPDSIEVGLETFKATAFPRPRYTANIDPVMTRPLTFDLGTDTDVLELVIANVGGAYPIFTGGILDTVASVGLGWELFTEGAAGALIPDNFFGFVTSTLNPDTVRIQIDRSLPTGFYSGSLVFQYTFGSLNMIALDNPILVQFQIQPPSLEITPEALNFGTDQFNRILTLRNTQQGTLNWSFNFAATPSWLTIPKSSGSLGPGESEEVNFSVSRQGLPAGGYEFDLVITQTHTNTQRIVTVTMIVP